MKRKKGNFIHTESRSVAASDRDTVYSAKWLPMSSREIFRVMKSSITRWWWQLHNSINSKNITDLYTYKKWIRSSFYPQNPPLTHFDRWGMKHSDMVLHEGKELDFKRLSVTLEFKSNIENDKLAYVNPVNVIWSHANKFCRCLKIFKWYVTSFWKNIE